MNGRATGTVLCTLIAECMVALNGCMPCAAEFVSRNQLAYSASVENSCDTVISACLWSFCVRTSNVPGSCNVLDHPLRAAGAFRQEKNLYVDPGQPLGKFLPQLHSIAEGESSGLRDVYGTLMPPCIIMEKGEALDVWIANSGDKIDMFTGLQVCKRLLTSMYACASCMCQG